MSVVGRVAPGSILVEIAGSDHTGSHVLRRDRLVRMLIANLAPFIEAVALRRFACLVGQRISIREASLLAGLQANRRTLAGSLTFALPHIDSSCVRGRIDIKAVVTGFSDGECQIRGIDFVDFATIEFADVQVQSTLMQLHLHSIIGDIREGQTGLGVDSQETGAEIQFGPGVLVRPNIVRVGQRTVG